MNRQILQLAIPSIVSNITVPLLGLVDVAITGHMGEPAYMAAIAVGSMVFNILYWFCSFLRFATGGITAQEYGRSRQPAKKSTAKGAIDNSNLCFILLKSQLTSLLIAVLWLVLQVPLFRVAMWLIEPEPHLVDIIHRYYNLCIWGSIPSITLLALSGWFVGMQNTRIPMAVSILQNVVNIALSYVFVYFLGMKIEGVALGTLTAQWCGLLIAWVMLLWRYGKMLSPIFREGITAILPRLAEGWGQFLAVNRTLFFRMLFIIAVNIYFIVAGSKGGAVTLSVNSVLMQMFILYSYVMDGFAFAAEALCGRYYGARNERKFRLALRGVWLWAAWLTAVYAVTYATGGQTFASILTDNESIRNAALEYMPWAVAIPLCGIAAFVLDGVFVGITETRGMLWGTSIGAIAFFAIYYALFPMLQNHALWLAFNVYLLLRGVVQGIIFSRRKVF